MRAYGGKLRANEYVRLGGLPALVPVVLKARARREGHQDALPREQEVHPAELPYLPDSGCDCREDLHGV